LDIEFILQVTKEIGFVGGSECVAFELHRAWLAHGVDARVVTSNATEPEAHQGITFIGAWMHNWFRNSRWRYLATFISVPLFTFIATWSVYRNRGRKLVVSHGDSLVGDVCVVHAVNQACLAEKRRGGYYGWLLNPTNLWVALRDRWMFGGNRYRRLIAISERVRRELKEYYNVPDDRIVTIPNGINLTRFTPGTAAQRAEVRREFGIPDDAKLILFVGSRFRIKGLKFAIESLAELQTNAYLVVVGDDNNVPFKLLAENLGVSERVIFAGSRTDLPRIYPAADVFLLPTLYETFALVCLEAMASGVPVVAAPVGGIEDYLHDGKNGLHISQDPSEIAMKLDILLNDETLRQSIVTAGLATAQSYGWDKIAEQYLKLFVDLSQPEGAKERVVVHVGKWVGVPDQLTTQGTAASL
jgi:glycosyltransferase involved in cell wall biosynthesis